MSVELTDLSPNLSMGLLGTLTAILGLIYTTNKRIDDLRESLEWIEKNFKQAVTGRLL